MPNAEISVIIVNYGTAALAIEAVESVRARRHGGRTVDIHLVDNASPGDDAAILAEAHRTRGWGEQVTLYPETVNHGFGRGNNLVLRRLAERATPPAHVFFLNPDARLDNETVSLLADVLDRSPDVAVAGGSIWRPDGRTQVSAAFRFPNFVGEFTSSLCLGLVEKPLRRFTVALPLSDEEQNVDWVSGACFIARFEVLKYMKFFRPDYFLYFEEVDLMHRLRRNGWRVRHAPQARIRHVAGAATGIRSDVGERKRKPDYWYDSLRKYFVLNHGKEYAFLSITAKITGWIINYPIRLLQSRTPNSPKYFLYDAFRFSLLPIFRNTP